MSEGIEEKRCQLCNRVVGTQPKVQDARKMMTVSLIIQWNRGLRVHSLETANVPAKR